ncbi:MAG: MotA/TolQ/ExbB proton channel family protein [Gammaproteobacteria bacterium]|nr:MotA/TolQ/ExbB proton channel family protein [Gammaproteobacteria bacterium]
MMNELTAGFLDLMARGGPVMWVIFLVAWVAIIMLVERGLRVYAWRRNAVNDQRMLEADKSFIPGKDLMSGQISGKSPVAHLTEKIEWNDVKGNGDVAEQLNIQLAELMPRLEGTLPTIAIIGSLLPMLGLLGTVTGMIQVFEVIALQGTGDPQEMAHGISQALLTTASGLIIAIPVIFFHHLLVRQLRYVLALTEQSMHAVYSQDFRIYQNNN